MDLTRAKQIPLPQILKSQLSRLARFGANLSDAHSCFIFLPTIISRLDGSDDSSRDERTPSVPVVELIGCHSLCGEIKPNCKIPSESGLVGWVAKHGRVIHVSPFEQDCRTLGMYDADQQLKSFIGIPIPFGVPQLGRSGEAGQQGSAGTSTCYGVLACDSKKSFAFSKIQGKLLEELAGEIGQIVALIISAQSAPLPERTQWSEFVARGENFVREIGGEHSELMRLRLANFDAIENTLGPGRAVALTEQVYRLIEQALPPHLPSFRFPHGDLVILVDNMMTGFYENKVRAICQHVVVDGAQVSFLFWKRPLKDAFPKVQSLERALREAMRVDSDASMKQGASQSKHKDSQGRDSNNREAQYEYRRA